MGGGGGKSRPPRSATNVFRNAMFVNWSKQGLCTMSVAQNNDIPKRAVIKFLTVLSGVVLSELSEPSEITRSRKVELGRLVWH